RRSQLGLEVDAGDLAAELVQLQDRGLDPGADIEDASAPRGGKGRARDIAGIDVVAGLLPFAEDPRRAALGQRAEENCHDPGFALRILPGSVDVSVAERDVI